MKINSTREVAQAFKGINKLGDLPEKIELQFKDGWTTLNKMGAGMAEGKPQTAYMSDDMEMITVSYEQNGIDINITNAKFSDATVLKTSNAMKGAAE